MNSVKSVENRQHEAKEAVFANFANAYGKALDMQAGRNVPQQQKEAAATVLGERAATAVPGERIDHQAAARGRAVLSGDAAAVLSGRVVSYDLPKLGYAGRDLDKLTEQGQRLAQAITERDYASRGRVATIGRDERIMGMASSGADEKKEKLTAHLLHVKSSIDAAVDRGQFDQTHGQVMYQRFEKAVFDPQAVQKGNQEYNTFAAAQAPRLQAEIAPDVARRFEAMRPTLDRAKESEDARIRAAEKVLQDQIKNLPAGKQSQIMGQFQEAIKSPENVSKLPAAQQAERQQAAPAIERTQGKNDGPQR